jgi:hypothetical protein
MTQSTTLHCRCGEVRGLVTNTSPSTVNRVICYCSDCQAFLHQLGVVQLTSLSRRTRVDFPGPPLDVNAASGNDAIPIELRGR